MNEIDPNETYLIKGATIQQVLDILAGIPYQQAAPVVFALVDALEEEPSRIAVN